MTPLERALARIARLLGEDGQLFALIGGLAVSARVEPRMTRDADLAVAAADDGAAEALVARLRGHGYGVATIVEHEYTGRLATVRLVHPDDAGLVTDLLFASSGVEPEIAAGADLLEITPGLVLPVASVGHLIATKLLARDDRRRPVDADDLRALAATASAGDWAVAGDAVRLIVERGYHRERDLVAALDVLRREGAY